MCRYTFLTQFSILSPCIFITIFIYLCTCSNKMSHLSTNLMSRKHHNKHCTDDFRRFWLIVTNVYFGNADFSFNLVHFKTFLERLHNISLIESLSSGFHLIHSGRILYYRKAQNTLFRNLITKYPMTSTLANSSTQQTGLCVNKCNPIRRHGW